jgi:hypothetical protein
VAPCAAHCIDLCLEDIASLPCCKDMFKKVTDVVKFFRGHTKLEQSFLRHSKGKKLILPASRRFETNFIKRSCALGQRDAMCQSMFDQSFKDLLKHRDSSVKAGMVKLHLKGESFWQRPDALLKLTAPICDLLDYCNSQVCWFPSRLYLLKGDIISPQRAPACQCIVKLNATIWCRAPQQASYTSNASQCSRHLNIQS